jgi:molecular chaperone HtpG
MQFQAEVSKLLKIVANSLYSQKEIFLRELISNASDACDRLRYEALTKPDLLGGDGDFRITLSVDPKAKTLTVSDNGIGMTRDELIDNLGTIARSGSAQAVEAMSGDEATSGDEADVSLIGQFGVGFYSAFIVSDKVDVISRRADSDQAWRWTSSGEGDFAVAEATREHRGTSVVVHLKKAEKEFLDPERLGTIVKTYSDHIGLPVVLESAIEGEDPKTLNEASALWTRPAKDITKDQYKEFYHHTAHVYDDPWATIHAKAEGRIEYSMLLYIPGVRPLDLFQPDRRARVRLYVRRVFISDEAEALLPSYLRFVRGVVDTEDLPLNVSRELLQDSPILAKIGSAVVKRVLRELEKRSDKKPKEFEEFWANFGAVLKEGIYEDPGRRDQLLKISRFQSTSGSDLTSLADYVRRMKDGQDKIHYIAGEDTEKLMASPHLEGFMARDIEVLLLPDAIDEFWVPTVGEFEGKKFVSVTQGEADFVPLAEDQKDDTDADDDKPAEGELSTLIALLKQQLGDQVKDVRTTDRLRESPVCLVAGDSDLDRHLARMLKEHGQLDKPPANGILEINPRHALIKVLAEVSGKPGASKSMSDAAQLLLDQARIIEGELPANPAAFSRRMANVMAAALSK